MTSPTGNVRPSILRLEDEVRQLRMELEALRSRSVRSAGEFTIKAPNGATTFISGPFASVPMPDGTPQWLTIIRDMNNVARWVLWDPNTVSGGFVQTRWEYDHLGNIVNTTDILGGCAEPWLAVPMYPLLASPAGVYFYYSNAVDLTERDLWEGSIGYVSHPCIGMRGIWGVATGTNNTRYRLKVNGVTVGTWDEATSAVYGTKGPFNILSATALNTRNVQVKLTAQTLSGTGSYAVQPLSCSMRQS